MWRIVKDKRIVDSDGFYTDYAWYTDGKKHIFMYGDIEMNDPDEEYADWETDSFKAAKEWFDNYNGFEEFEEDSYSINESSESIYNKLYGKNGILSDTDNLDESKQQIYDIEYTDRESGEQRLKDTIKGINQADAIDRYFRNQKNASNEITKITKREKLNEVAPLVAAAAGAALTSFASTAGSNLANKLMGENKNIKRKTNYQEKKCKVTESVDDENVLGPASDEPSVQASYFINDLIVDEWEAIDGYNTAIINLSEAGVDSGIIEVLKDIVAEENMHIGQLQAALNTVAPNSEYIEKGQEEAEDQL